ncbi:MAG: ATP-dependent helicase [Nitrospirae bacterium]|nr:ATP-dependent helicase [Nitrospirota bacterium]
MGIDFDADLNQAQLDVVTHPDAPMLVLAGAGTGKTRTITYRVVWLIEHGIRPSNILLLTFTNKAAKEMMRRAGAIISTDTRGLWGGTFHHIGNAILRGHAPLVGYKDGFSILDATDARELIDSCLAEFGKQSVIMPKGAVLYGLYSFVKNTGRTLESVVEERYPSFVNQLQRINDLGNSYEKKKLQLNLMDFDDILHNLRLLLLEHMEVREHYSSQFKHILVDEYQDTNCVQSEIVDLLGSVHRNVMVVGDDAQSIYSFRGASLDNILSFTTRYPEAKVFKLTVNYRSTPQILDVANASICNNTLQYKKDLCAVCQGGPLPCLVPLADNYEQAAFVVSRINDLLDEDISLSDIGVLYRSHYQSMELQMELQRHSLPYEVRSGLRFFEQAHVKDVLAYIKLIVNPYDEISCKRLLKMIQGVGNVTSDKVCKVMASSPTPLEALSSAGGLIAKKGAEGFANLLETLKRLGSIRRPSDALDAVLKSGVEHYLAITYPNAQNRIEDIVQLAAYADRYDGMEDFINDMSLQDVSGPATVRSQERPGAEKNESDKFTHNAGHDRGSVVLSSVHQAKGLEWKAVFVIGLNDGKFPSGRALMSSDEEEERRLFYVAITRACKELYLCYALALETGFARPSRFIREVPYELFEEIDIIGSFAHYSRRGSLAPYSGGGGGSNDLY